MSDFLERRTLFGGLAGYVALTFLGAFAVIVSVSVPVEGHISGLQILSLYYELPKGQTEHETVESIPFTVRVAYFPPERSGATREPLTDDARVYLLVTTPDGQEERYVLERVEPYIFKGVIPDFMPGVWRAKAVAFDWDEVNTMSVDIEVHSVGRVSRGSRGTILWVVTMGVIAGLVGWPIWLARRRIRKK